MVRSSSVATMSDHASRRLAQRNLTTDDVQYVYTHGRLHHRGKATFVHLGLRDIPAEDLREDRYRRLEGTVLVLDPDDRLSSHDGLPQPAARKPGYPPQAEAIDPETRRNPVKRPLTHPRRGCRPRPAQTRRCGSIRRDPPCHSGA